MALPSSSTFRSSACQVLLRNGRAIAICVALALVGLVASILMVAADSGLAGMPMIAIFGSAVAAFSFWKYHYWPVRLTGELLASEQGLELAGRPVVARDYLSRGIVVQPYGGKPRVRLLGHEGELKLEVEVPSEAEGQVLLAAAKLDAAHSVATFRLNSYWFGKLWVVVLLGWMPMLVGIGLAVSASGLAERLGLREGSVGSLALYGSIMGTAVVGAVLLFHRSRLVVRIGPDGVHLRGLGRSRFIRYAEVAELRPWKGQSTPHGRAMPEGFDLVLHGGEVVRLRTYAQRLASGQMQDDLVADQIALAMRAQHPAASTALAALEQGQRTVAEWLEHLRHLGADRSADYRAGALPDETLWRRLEDPTAEPRERLASAIVLGVRADAGTKGRLEQAAEAVALPALRAALGAAVTGDDEALTGALSRLGAGL
jgi:hypothetical protein